LDFIRGLEKVLVFEELEPVVERIIKQILFEEKIELQVLGRSSFLPAVGELTAEMAISGIQRVTPDLGEEEVLPPVDLDIPLRTRTQCVGCSYRGLLHALKGVVRKHDGIVTGDIGCHDMGSFPPLNLQSTIYCMGSSIPIASGLVCSGIERPVFSIMGDSTFFHNGLPGLINAIRQGKKLVVVICNNGTTAMTGFQPHPGSETNLLGEQAPRIDIENLVRALGVRVQIVNPYQIPEVKTALETAMADQGVSVIISTAPCYLNAKREGRLPFEEREVHVDAELCTGCMLCINDFGCPALRAGEDVVGIDPFDCVKCGMCIQVCHRGVFQ
jgi:indolepyruvate ferredoxin oxidoreductase alpha subunit